MRAAVSAACLLLAAHAARAQVPASPDELPPLELGPVARYATEADARRQCPYDIVVWADPNSGYFYPHWHPKFGRTPGGAYACMREALRSDYWDINPFASNPERGREFPIDPDLLPFGS